MSNGKGSAPRPKAVPPDEYERRWKQTFQRTPMTNEPLSLEWQYSTQEITDTTLPTPPDPPDEKDL